MGPGHGTPASGTNAPILRLSLLALGFSLFFVSAARADTWSAGAFTTYDQSEWGDGTFSTSSNTAVVIASEPSKRSQQRGKSLIAGPYRGPITGCAAMILAHPATSFACMGRHCRGMTVPSLDRTGRDMVLLGYL